MSLSDRFKSLFKTLKIAAICSGTGLFVAYHIRGTYKTMEKVVNPSVLDYEKKHSEYIYIDDPSYTAALEKERIKDSKPVVGFSRIWKSVKHSVAWRLLWLCRHGNREQRNIALERLAAFKNNKTWDCFKLAQAMDKNTAVLLARTRGSDLRYFLPPPLHVRRSALSTELLSFKFRDIIVAVNKLKPHSCIHHFLSKYFINIQEQAVDHTPDHIASKPDSITEKRLCALCVDAIYHHLSLFHVNNYSEDTSATTLIKVGLLPRLAELLMRYSKDSDIQVSILGILTILSIHSELLADFFENGLIGELSRMLRSKDVRIASSAAVCLANLSGEFSYRPGLFLLHPLYRTTTPTVCDTLLVHGLRGGVFVTWRQRDRKCVEPIGILEDEKDRWSYTFCWPKDWLSQDCPNLRILGVNYWSSLSEWLERCPLLTADIEARADELASILVSAGVGKKNIPIVWLSHSMGGLIVKEVLIESSRSEDENYRNICDNTKALFFYSTPHKGSALASMPRAAAAILWPSNDVKQLQVNSPALLEMHNAFLKLAEKYSWHTISFGESNPTLITAFKVPVHFVEPSSSDLGRGVHYQLPLDHLSICKPETRQSLLYTVVLDTITKLTAETPLSKSSNPFIKWWIRWFWWILRQQPVDESKNDDDPRIRHLKWLERFVLGAFSDGFTD